jgi:ferredoxin-NADP reductase
MKEYKYFIQKISKPTDDVLTLELGDIRGLPVFDFKPGQYVMIYYKNFLGRLEQKHTFSIASSPLEKKFIRLGIKLGGKFTRGLLNLKAGHEIIVQGPYGNFVYDENKYLDMVMIAGGIGITPFLSAMNYAVDKNLPNKLSLIYSNRTLAGTAFYSEIRNAEKGNKNFRTLFTVTGEKLPPAYAGFINSRLNPAIIQEFIGGVYGKSFFLCGPGPFMRAARNNLIALGADQSEIRMEAFSMPGSNFWPGVKNITYATTVSAAVFLLAYYSINNTVLNSTKAVKKSYDPLLLQNINKSVTDRLAAINNEEAKSTSLLQQTAASSTLNIVEANTQTSQPTAISQPTSTPQPTLTPPPAPVPQPTPAPQPTPRTGMS